MKLDIEQFPCLSDNYGLLAHEPTQNKTAAIDTPDAAPILAALKRRGWQLDTIFNTHHHGDHTGGNLALKEATGCEIVGPRSEADKIPGLDRAVAEGDEVQLGAAKARVLEVGGHTLGHIAFHFADAELAFVGDSLFSLGCGRMFEGDAEQMWRSLAKLKALPPATLLYCAHEYTQGNARFALSVDGDNAALKARAEEIAQQRAADQPTVPTRLAQELATNPFLRPDDKKIRAALNMPHASDVEVFAELRRRKDSF